MVLKFLKNSTAVVGKQQASLKYLLHKKMGGWEESRDHSQVHASDLTREDFCAREFCLCDLTGKKPAGQYINTSLQATFDLGRALQDMLNQDWGVDWCIGNWKCRNCGQVYGFQKRPDFCEKCAQGHSHFEYEEVMFVHPEYGFTGSVDFIFANGAPKKKVTEVKTIVKDDFKKLKAPLAEHRLRTTLYIEMAATDAKRGHEFNQTEGTILYICKGYGVKDDSLHLMGLKDGGFSPFKEFTIKRNPDLLKSTIEKGRLVHEFRENGTMPDRVCPTSYCPRAKYCPVKSACWTGDY